MRLAFFTKEREPDYLAQSLKSLEASDWRHTKIPVSIFLGGDNEKANTKYEEIEWVGGNYEVRHNVNLNYWRALTHHHNDDIVVFEDDIIFGRNWMAKLFCAICEIEHYNNKKNYIISLYMHDNPRKMGLWFAKYKPSPNFWGSQGIYYPQRQIQSVANEIIHGINDHFADLLIGRWWKKRGNEIYTPIKSIIQHNGNVSGADSQQHTAPNFEE